MTNLSADTAYIQVKNIVWFLTEWQEKPRYNQSHFSLILPLEYDYSQLSVNRQVQPEYTLKKYFVVDMD